MKKPSLPRVEVSGDTRTYCNDKNEEMAWFLDGDGKMTQARFYLSDAGMQQAAVLGFSLSRTAVAAQ